MVCRQARNGLLRDARRMAEEEVPRMLSVAHGQTAKAEAEAEHAETDAVHAEADAVPREHLASSLVDSVCVCARACVRACVPTYADVC